MNNLFDIISKLMTSPKNENGLEQGINNNNNYNTQIHEPNVQKDVNLNTDYPDVFFTNSNTKIKPNKYENQVCCNCQCANNMNGLNGITSFIPKLFGGVNFDFGKLASSGGLSNIMSIFSNKKNSNISKKDNTNNHIDETNNIDLSDYVEIE